jgi:hypothetical protein
MPLPPPGHWSPPFLRCASFAPIEWLREAFDNNPTSRHGSAHRGELRHLRALGVTVSCAAG